MDIGAINKEDAEKKVSIGDPMVLDVLPLELGENLIASKSCDNRVGAMVLLRVMDKLKIHRDNGAKFTQVAFVATVKEEIGIVSQGALTSTYQYKPNMAICIDGTFATDHPDSDEKRASIKLGGGPVIHRGNVSDKEMVSLLRKVAKEGPYEIKTQLEATPGYSSTDADYIQSSRKGVRTALISYPTRYMHTPCEMVSFSDIEETAELITRFVLETK